MKTVFVMVRTDNGIIQGVYNERKPALNHLKEIAGDVAELGDNAISKDSDIQFAMTWCEVL